MHDADNRMACARRRQQVGLTRQRHGAEREQEAIAVFAQVHREAPGGQLCGKCLRFGDESTGTYHLAASQDESALQVVVC